MPAGIVATTSSQPSRESGADGGEHRLNDPGPVLPEVEDESESGPDVQPDDEGEPVRLGVALDCPDVLPAEQPREYHGVTEARDWEELAHPLDQAEDYGLQVRDPGVDVMLHRPGSLLV